GAGRELPGIRVRGQGQPPGMLDRDVVGAGDAGEGEDGEESERCAGHGCLRSWRQCRPARGVTPKSAALERATFQALLETLETLAQRDDAPRQRALAVVLAVAEDAGDVGPGETPVDAQDEESLLVGVELGAEPRDAVASLGARAGERLAADLRRERGDLRQVRQRHLASLPAAL